jgi:hypothetical protein
MEAKLDGGPSLRLPPVGAGNSAICHNCEQSGHFKVNCLKTQLQRWTAGVCAEAKDPSDKAQGASPEEDVKVVDPQGERNEPDYQEYPTDIPCEWDTEEVDIPEWDDEFDNDTQTECQVNMILIGNEYHKRNTCLWQNMQNMRLAH